MLYLLPLNYIQYNKTVTYIIYYSNDNDDNILRNKSILNKKYIHNFTNKLVTSCNVN